MLPSPPSCQPPSGSNVTADRRVLNFPALVSPLIQALLNSGMILQKFERGSNT